MWKEEERTDDGRQVVTIVILMILGYVLKCEIPAIKKYIYIKASGTQIICTVND